MPKALLVAARRTRLKRPTKRASLVKQAELRTMMGSLRQSDIATLLEISPSHVSYILKGKRQPSVEIAASMAKILRVSVDRLLDVLNN